MSRPNAIALMSGVEPSLRRDDWEVARYCNFTRFVRRAIGEAMALHGEIAKENASFKKVNDSMMDFTSNGYQWFQVAEVGYDNFMARHSQS